MFCISTWAETSVAESCKRMKFVEPRHPSLLRADLARLAIFLET